MAADGTDHCDHLQFVIGSMGRTGGEQVPVTRTDTSAAYSDIVFTLPDAWASYTLTITMRVTPNGAALAGSGFGSGGDLTATGATGPNGRPMVSQVVGRTASGKDCDLSLATTGADTIPLTPAGEQADDGSTPATLDRAYLENLSFAELKRLANDMDVPVTKTTKKAELIDTLAAETVTVPAEADDTEPDFGEV